MQAVRPRTLLAVAALVIAAGGVATASAIATRGPSAVPGPELHLIDETVVVAGELFPTSADSPDPKQVATGKLDLKRLDPTRTTTPNRPVRLAAECTNCAPGSTAAEQYKDLIVEVKSDSGATVYQGPLAELDAKLTEAKKPEVKVWLADTGKPQVQGVLTEWSFTATEE